MNYLLVFAGGGAGCVVRFLIGQIFIRSNIQLPIATLMANLSACIIFALVVWYNVNKGDPGLIRPLLLTGFCGGLSTFSSFGFETYLLLQKQLYGIALINIFLSCTLCIAVFYLLGRYSQN